MSSPHYPSEETAAFGMTKNRDAWDKLTAIHYASDFYAVEDFVNNSDKSSLNKIELQELGDVAGKTILHLQCHFGQDTLSFVRAGAKRCVGIDFSEEAISHANRLAERTNLQDRVEFKVCNVYDTVEALAGEKFDIVFTSYGVLGWLPDLNKWAKVINDSLKPGGTFYIAEFHPLIFTFDFWEPGQPETEPKWIYPYMSNEPDVEELNCGTYADQTVKVKRENVSWNHGIGNVVTALLSQGLNLQFFREHLECPYYFGESMEKGPGGGYVRKGSHRMMYPLVYSIRAEKLSP